MGLKSGSKSGKGVKQSSAKVGLSKSTPQSSNREMDSDDEPDVDTSVMRPSIEVSVSGIPQLVRAYQAATEELKSILARECDIIYECRVCRNLFRSLANMMAHKRIYCKTTYSYTKHTLNRNHLVEDYTVVIQPEPVPSNSQNKQNWTTSDKIPECLSENMSANPQVVPTTSRMSTYSNPKKGLREIVDRLAKNTYDNSKEVKYSSATELYDTISASILARRNDQNEHSYQLEDIETTKVGMYQTKLVSSIGTEKDDLMKAQVSELQLMSLQSEAVLGPDGQTLTLNRHSPLSAYRNVSEKNLDMNTEANEYKSTKDKHVCPDCNVKFSTRKTLNHHMKSLHVTFRLCYPCPCCKSTFVNPWSVYRHLYKVHRKTAAQVRRMRPQIQKKAFKKEIHSEIPVSQNSTKNDAINELQRLDQENQAWMDNFEDDLELQRCGGCGRRFERRAALNSHSQICQKRIAARNSVKTIRNLSNMSSTDKIIKISRAEDQTTDDANKKSNNANKNVGSVDTILNTMVASRIHQSGNWVDQPKKEVRGKKIEIQIRKDYCKMSSASSVVALSNDTQSEPDSRPPSRIVEDHDDHDYGEVRDWEAVIEMEEENKEKSDSEYPLSQEAECSDNDQMNEDDKNNEHTLCTNSLTEVSGSDLKLSSGKDNILQEHDKRNKELSVFERQENVLKRRMSDDGNCLLRQQDGKAVKKRRQSYDGVVEESYNVLTSRNKKLEQFHPVMEARMKKLINLRRLQCLPCQKKFIKLTNLRRHVAVHIGWCRYKCILCPFKCFSKYDCVDHVCKIHLKGTQRSKAVAMVEYIEEQESEATVSSVQLEELNDYTDHLSNGEEGPETLAVEINSLNLEDIKNIVGVTNYPNVTNKCEISSETQEDNVKNKSSLLQNSDQSDVSLSINDQRCLISSGIVKIQSTDIQNFREEKENAKCIENKGASFEDAQRSEGKHMHGEISYPNILSSCDNSLNIENSHSTKNLNRDTQDEVPRPNVELCCGVLNVNEETNKLDHVTGVPNDGPEARKQVSALIPVNKEMPQTTSLCLINGKQKSETIELMIEDSSNESVTIVEDISAEKSLSLEQMQLTNNQELQQISPKEQMLNAEIELLTECAFHGGSPGSSPCVNGNTDVESLKSPEMRVPSENKGSSVNPSTTEDAQNALRKMVMEVIFGSGGSSNTHPDPNQNLISVSMNGNIIDEDSSDGRYSRASSASDPDVIIINNHLSPTSKVMKHNIDLDHGHYLESERRERPVRNRVKVEKEDFIYDFTDSFLKKEETLKAGSSSSGSYRKKQTDTGKETVKYDTASTHNSGVYKSVPKLMLVRTDTSEPTGNKRLTGPIKGSWSSVCASSSELNNKSFMASSTETCSSSRKVPHDIKP